jgi:Thymidylate synthase
MNQFGASLRVRNVNEALPIGLQMLQAYGKPAESRGLQTLRVPGPVTTIYERPEERVLFDRVRDANPFFHLIESLWILGGSNRVELPSMFLNGITRFSDNGVTFHGAYGHRLRKAFGFDQILRAIELLVSKPDTRQCVMSIWHPELDMRANTKDMPCNDMVMLDLVNGRLNMTVCNRSNDAIWGAYGANAVQFSMLQEFIAIYAKLERGFYVQQSNNFHAYTDNLFWLAYNEGKHDFGHVTNPYTREEVQARPIAESTTDAVHLLADCEGMCAQVENGEHLESYEYRSSFGQTVVRPVVRAYGLYKVKMYESALQVLEEVAASDWRLAMQQWVQRRAEKAVQA